MKTILLVGNQIDVLKFLNHFKQAPGSDKFTFNINIGDVEETVRLLPTMPWNRFSSVDVNAVVFVSSDNKDTNTESIAFLNDIPENIMIDHYDHAFAKEMSESPLKHILAILTDLNQTKQQKQDSTLMDAFAKKPQTNGSESPTSFSIRMAWKGLMTFKSKSEEDFVEDRRTLELSEYKRKTITT